MIQQQNEIIEFTKSILDVKNIVDLDNLIDNYLDPIKDYTDTVGDIISPIKPLITISNLKRKLTFRSFIKKYASEFYSGYSIDENETLRLQKYLGNKKNILFVSEVIDNALNSRSLKSTSILGVIAGKIIRDKTELDYKSFSIIDSLKVMNDLDIENFITLYEYLPIVGTSHPHTDEYRTTDFYKNDNKNKLNIDRNSLELTIEKLKRTNGFTYSSGGIGQAGNSKGAFEINEITDELYNLVKNINVE